MSKINKIKKFILKSLLIIFSLSASAQTPTGKYTRNNIEYLNFLDNGRVEFYFERTGCLGQESLVGEGDFTIRKNKLKIKVDTHNKDYESTFEQVSSIPKPENSEVEFRITDTNKNPLPFVNIVYEDPNGNYQGTVTNEFGVGKLIIPDSLNSEVEISLVGYSSAFVPANKINSGVVVVSMKEGNTIFLDNSTVLMKIILDNTNQSFELEKIKIKRRKQNNKTEQNRHAPKS